MKQNGVVRLVTFLALATICRLLRPSEATNGVRKFGLLQYIEPNAPPDISSPYDPLPPYLSPGNSPLFCISAPQSPSPAIVYNPSPPPFSSIYTPPSIIETPPFVIPDPPSLPSLSPPPFNSEPTPATSPAPPENTLPPCLPFLSPPSYNYEPSAPYAEPSPVIPTQRPRFLPPVVYPPPSVPPPPYREPITALWCVAKAAVPDPIIQEAMNYACGSDADCNEIQPGRSCFQPATLFAHASYAFNSYWQRTKVAGGTCDFGGTALLVTVDPSYDGCHFIYTYA